MPTSLGSVNAARSADHTLSIAGATAGRTVVVVVGIAAAITLHADSVSAGWVQDDYGVNNMGVGVYRLPAASNGGGTLTSLRLTHNGPRALSGCAFEDDITGLADSAGPNESSSTFTTDTGNLAAGDLVIAYFSIASSAEQTNLDVTAYSDSFTELVDSGYQDGGGDENTRTWVAYREDFDPAAAITATHVNAGGGFFCGGGVLVYSLGAPPAGASGTLQGTFPAPAGAFTGLAGHVGQLAGTFPAPAGAFTGLAGHVGAVAGTFPAAVGAFAGTGGAVAVPAPAAGGGWDLLQIVRSAQQGALQRARSRPVACPRCGEPLTQGRRGELRCTFDGWTPSA